MSQSSPGHVSFLGPRTQNDAAGNLTTDRQGYTYEYDYENRITKILKAGPVTVAEYSYDALGRRVEKKDSVTSTNTRRYYYDKDWRVLDEYDGSGTLKRRYMCGNYIDEVLFSWVAPPGTHRYYVHDHLYSPVALLWYDSSVLERYEYDAYGEPNILDGSYTPRSPQASSYDNAYMFTGRQVDILDGGALKIQYNRNRYYDYYTGRWTPQDPAGNERTGQIKRH